MIFFFFFVLYESNTSQVSGITTTSAPAQLTELNLLTYKCLWRSWSKQSLTQILILKKSIMEIETSKRTCWDSSRVGTRTKALGASFFRSALAVKSFWSNGKRYANVFPEPVLALATTSLPSWKNTSEII